MFVGHLAVALGAKRATPRAPLAWLVAATFGLDLLWPIFLLAGIEEVRINPGDTAFTPLAFAYYPWSHSFVTAIAWGLLAGAIAAKRFQDRRVGAIIGATVPSHWILDVVAHRPDLPLWPGGPKLGLGLWSSIPATFIVEGLFFFAMVELYRRAFAARDRMGRWAFRALIAFVSAIWFLSPFSPPPPSVTAIIVVGLALWVLVPWARFIERHRLHA
jgi:hypothetical protein